MYTPIQAVLDSRHDASERRSQLVNKASLYLSLRRFAVCIEHLTHQKVSKPRHSSRGIVQDLSGGFPNRLILPTNSKNVVTKFILVYLCRSMMQCGGKKNKKHRTNNFWRVLAAMCLAHSSLSPSFRIVPQSQEANELAEVQAFVLIHLGCSSRVMSCGFIIFWAGSYMFCRYILLYYCSLCNFGS